MKLRAILPCDRVLDVPGSGPSLVTTFNQFNALAPAGTEIPRDAVIPRDWAIYTVWRLEEDEFFKPYTLCSEIYLPDGQAFGKSSIPADSNKAHHFLTFIGKANAFPIGQVGLLKIVVWVECEGKRVSDVEETVIIVGRMEAPVAENIKS